MMYQISDIEEAVESRLTTKNGSRATTSADAILIGTLAVLQVARALQRIADVGEQYSREACRDLERQRMRVARHRLAVDRDRERPSSLHPGADDGWPVLSVQVCEAIELARGRKPGPALVVGDSAPNTANEDRHLGLPDAHVGTGLAERAGEPLTRGQRRRAGTTVHLQFTVSSIGAVGSPGYRTRLPSGVLMRSPLRHVFPSILS